jgi:hypothetical protein
VVALRSASNIRATSSISLWSRLRFVSTEMAGANSATLPSLSSVSITSQSLPPTRMLPGGIEPGSDTAAPPPRNEGSRPASTRMCAIIVVTDDFPLVPATAMVRCSDATCARNEPRRMHATPSSTARWKSGLPVSTAVEWTKAVRSGVIPEPS